MAKKLEEQIEDPIPVRRVTGIDFMTDKDRNLRRGITAAADKASEEDYKAYRKNAGYSKGGTIKCPPGHKSWRR